MRNYACILLLMLVMGCGIAPKEGPPVSKIPVSCAPDCSDAALADPNVIKCCQANLGDPNATSCDAVTVQPGQDTCCPNIVRCAD